MTAPSSVAPGRNVPVNIDPNDPDADAMRREAPLSTGPRTYFGEVTYFATRPVGNKKSGKRWEDFDANRHTKQWTEIAIAIKPLKEGYETVERDMLNWSKDWLGQPGTPLPSGTLTSLEALKITIGAVREKFVQYQLRETGEIYLDRKELGKALGDSEIDNDDLNRLTGAAQRLWDSVKRDPNPQEAFNSLAAKNNQPAFINALRVKKSPYILAVYQTREECDAAAEAFFANRHAANGNGAAQTAATSAPTAASSSPAAAPSFGANPSTGDIQKDFALQSLGFLWNQCQPDRAKFAHELATNASFAIARNYFNANSPEVIALIGAPQPPF